MAPDCRFPQGAHPIWWFSARQFLPLKQGKRPCNLRVIDQLYVWPFPAKGEWQKIPKICLRFILFVLIFISLDCQLSVQKPNPRQYIADIPSLPNLEVWFQRASDVVRKIRTGDVDLGIVGYDMVCEYGEGDDDLIIVHDALEFGECHLAIGVPTYGIFANVSSMEELAAMPQWSADRPLRIVTGYTYLGKQFVQKAGLKHVQLLTADGALEAAPAMGTADAILDLVSSGTTLRENNLKQIDGGLVLKSQGVLVASKRALLHRPTALETTHEILERLEAHLRARGQFTIIANMRGKSSSEVAERILRGTSFHGLQGPTISPVFSENNGTTQENYFAIVICVPKKQTL